MLPRPPRPTLFPYTTLFRSLDQAQIILGPVLAVHRRQDGVGARLHRQMQEGHQLVIVAMGQNQVVTHVAGMAGGVARSEEHTSELQSLRHLVCRLLLEKKKN